MLGVLTLVASLAAALAFTSAASADKLAREPAPSADVTGSFCADFDVLVHVTGDKGKAVTFSSGRTTISGQLKVELTNLETDKTVARNISGPVFISADGSTVTLSGRSMLFGEAGEFGPDPILWITSGPDIVTLDSEGNITGFTTSGRVIDMCEVLA